MAITGPEVARKLTPSSRATICASVVLPRPGRADEQHVVERLAARPCAASMKTCEVRARLLLADELVERLRPQRRVGVVLALVGREQAAVGDRLIAVR